MTIPISNEARKVWDEWNLRVAVLVSLFFQILLIFLAPSRKHTRHIIVTMLVWGAYLLADWVAAFAVGVISSGQGDECDKYRVNDDLAAFWAPFLLLHLGGPDTITAFSLEDNELWLRHLLGLLIQLAAVVYAFWQSVPNQFWIPTIFMFFAGTIKYVERTRALYLACPGNLKHSMLPNYALLMAEVKSMLNNIPVGKGSRTLEEESLTPKPFTDIEVVKNGYIFFQIIKRLTVFLTFTVPERHKSRKFFLEMTYKDAFRVMEVELNFMYDALYTKMVVVHCKLGYFFRFICSVLIVVSFALFASHHKHHLHHLDIIVTYTLLIGAVGMDLVSLAKLIFSNCTIVSLNNSNAKEIVFTIKEKLSFEKRSHRSNSVSQHSLMSYCINERFKWIEKVVDFFGLMDFLDEMRYTRTSPVNDDLKEFIFMELKNKALQAEDPEFARNICLAKGNWVLSKYDSLDRFIVDSVRSEVEYDHSLLMWHIATEICYYKGEDSVSDEANSQNREFCKILSDYMLYLIVMRPTLMSTVEGIAQIRIDHTCEKARKVLKSHLKKPPNMYENFKKFFQRRQTESMLERLIACKILGVEYNMAEFGSKSVLVDGCNLAKELNELESKRRWEIMSRVWVELLSYAATHCGGNAHAQQLSKGGELITFVWLLMAHFGLTERLPIGLCMAENTK